MSRHLIGPTRALVIASALVIPSFAASATKIRATNLTPSETLDRIEEALDAGDLVTADSLRAAALAVFPPGLRHLQEIVDARLAASRGDWRGADARLRAWRTNPQRREGSGDVLFWLGWSAMHQARASEADSLLVLASAYGEDARSQDALEYRLAGLLENGPALQDYLRGLPESPLPDALRISSLERVSPGSRLFPHARWHLAVMLEARGDTVRSRPLLDTLARDTRSAPGRRAAAYRALLWERRAPDTSLKAYEEVLIGGQQGVTAEIARKRIRALKARR